MTRNNEQVRTVAQRLIAEAECDQAFATLPHLATMYDIYTQLCVDRDHIADRALSHCYEILGAVLSPNVQPLVLHDEPMEPYEWLALNRQQAFRN